MGDNYEQLGAFYLGRRFDASSNTVTEEPILYDAKDLTTHALCVGMTGSGKTGLGVVLLEEAAIDGVPILAIDPKGDLGNLMLTFPELRGSDFEPWVDAAAATRKGHTVAEHARSLADLWRKGLAEWGQAPDRIARYEGSAQRTIYTPGSRAGVPLAVLRSFDAPPAAIREDPELLRESIAAAVSGLLALVGIDADPLRSREHILLSTILDHSWSQGQNLDLAGLIGAIQTPPFEKVGVFGLDAFFDEGDRFELAMTLNNLLASPGFSVWMEGEQLDIHRLLYTPEGKPRLSILSIAHLSDNERMFFVTALLNELLSWTRAQPGTQSLRAILYMDEIFGYFPPSANPPSKGPMLTLLKQARAFGVGIVLATQNPVDLDYKGLSNAGTWFLGRLQTERDKARILDGLEGAQAGSRFDRKELEALISGLDSRVFLMNNVHEDAPVLFQTRWALSYLGGPLTREQIRRLTQDRPAAAPTEGTESEPQRERAQSIRSVAAPPSLPPGIAQRCLDVVGEVPSDQRLLYRPALMARATLHYANARMELDEWREQLLLAAVRGKPGVAIWKGARTLDPVAVGVDAAARIDGEFARLPAGLDNPKDYRRYQRMLESHLYSSCKWTLWRCKRLKATSQAEESESEFRARVASLIRERRDLQVEKLRARLAPRLARLQEQIRAAEIRVEKEEAQKSQAGLSTAINLGTTVLGALFGRKLTATNVRGAGSAMRSAGRVRRESQDVAHAEQKAEALRQKLQAMEAELEERTESIREEHAAEAFPVEPIEVAPRKSDIEVDELCLAWTPWRVDADGVAEAAF